MKQAISALKTVPMILYQSPVYEPLVLEVGHAVADLHAEVAERGHGEAGAQGGLLQTLQQRPQRSKLRHLARGKEAAVKSMLTQKSVQ